MRLNTASKPIAPIRLSFIASSCFFLPAAIPSAVSISPSRCNPPVSQIPLAIINRGSDSFGQFTLENISHMQPCIILNRSPTRGAKRAIRLNFGLIFGSLGRTV